ncbi:MAG: hypothetical protein C0596_03070 [Marinilabiliales bacterium]|nr:MAG: hypothetical protein C0596_03070 [Marinilabiliales bacterium]
MMLDYLLKTIIVKKHIYTIVLLFTFPIFIIAQETHVITQSGMAFDPPSITVNVGDTIKWVWTGGTHTTTSTTVPNGASEWNNPLTSTDMEFKYKVLVAGTYDYHCIPHQSMGMTGSFTAVSTTEIKEDIISELSIYPNPAKDEIFVEGLKSNTELQIYNVAGVLIEDYTLNNKNSINISDFNPGMYLLRVYNIDSQEYKVLKFMKE